MKPRVFVTRRIAQEALDLLATSADVTVWEGASAVPRQVLLEGTKAAEGLLSMLTDAVDAALLDSAPVLRVVSNMAVGYDNIQVEEATRRGVLVGNTPGVLVNTCADFAFALILAAARRVPEGDRFVRAHQWKEWHPALLLGMDIHGATLGILGLGAIGLEVAKRARGFDMNILYYSRHRRHEEENHFRLTYVPSLDTLLQEADILTIHVPLNEETRHMIGARQLSIMKPHVVLVNTSRGAVIDQRALYEALRDGVIARAAIDVAEEEPIPPDDPLLTLPNVTITPHIASASVASRTRMAVLAARNLLAGLGREPMPHCVNLEALQHQRVLKDL